MKKQSGLKKEPIKRLNQIMNMEDSYCVLMKQEDQLIGLAIGCFKTYWDLSSYYLEEIFIGKDYPNQCYGTQLVNHLINYAKKHEAKKIELINVNDEM